MCLRSSASSDHFNRSPTVTVLEYIHQCDDAGGKYDNYDDAIVASRSPLRREWAFLPW